MKKLLFLMLALVLMAGASPVAAQDIKRQGNMFVEQSTQRKASTGTKTKYTYKAKDGKVYPVYLSKNGKAYIIRVSKKTGKEYKQYLPEVTAQINSKP